MFFRVICYYIRYLIESLISKMLNVIKELENKKSAKQKGIQ